MDDSTRHGTDGCVLGVLSIVLRKKKLIFISLFSRYVFREKFPIMSLILYASGFAIFMKTVV